MMGVDVDHQHVVETLVARLTHGVGQHLSGRRLPVNGLQ